MKKIIAIIITAVCALQLVGCGEKPSDGAKIDYGTSSLYTREEMDEAIEAIKEEFDTWDGCELHSLTYCGDSECGAENVAWLNDIKKGRDIEETLTQFISFKSYFHSPLIPYGSWESDKEYYWDFSLGRSDGGEWKLVTCGYH